MSTSKFPTPWYVSDPMPGMVVGIRVCEKKKETKPVLNLEHRTVASRQEYWSGLPFLSPGDLPDAGIEPGSPAFQADTLASEPPGKPLKISIKY